MTDNGFRFDADAHIYWLGKRVIPSVTQTLQATGLGPDFRTVRPDIIAHKRRLGRYIHRAAEFLLENDLDEDSLAIEFKPYVDALKLFLKDTGFKVERVEQARHTELSGMPYGMTLDFTGIMRGEPWLIDIKTTEGPALYCWAIQLSAYQHGVGAPLVPPFHWRRASLQLLSSGRYKLTPWKDHDGDLLEFQWALALVWRRLNRGEKVVEGR